MKFNCGLTWQEKLEAREQWHRWFAWRPVRVATRDCRWLEYIERKITHEIWGMDIYTKVEYRALK
jgi:hypothetical protein